MATGEYSVEDFQRLPSLRAVRGRFLQLGGDELVRGVFRKFFTDQRMERRFGLAMLHRHFDLCPGEMLVDYDGTSVPWNARHVPGLRTPQPVVWAVSGSGDFRPTEFRYAERDGFAIGRDEQRFMRRFKELLHRHGATDVFGLCQYPGDDFDGLCEITRGRANINLKPADVCNRILEVTFDDLDR